MNSFHLGNSAEWGTPTELIESARVVLGEIDLDPATTEEINARTVRATSYLTAEHDSLTLQWRGRVFVNPPGSCPLELVPASAVAGGSRVDHVRRAVCGTEARLSAGNRNPPCSCRLVPRFWERLVGEYVAGRVTAAIWIGFSLEQLAALQRADLGSPMDYPLCVVGPARTRYLDPAADFTPAGSPTHSSFVSYLGPRPSLFRAEFSKHGACK